MPSQSAADPRCWDDLDHRWRCTADEQRACWCQPFITVGGYVLHRPDYGYVFWEDGEQGQMTLDQVIREADSIEVEA